MTDVPMEQLIAFAEDYQRAKRRDSMLSYLEGLRAQGLPNPTGGPRLDPAIVMELRRLVDEGMNGTLAAKHLGVSKSTAIGYLAGYPTPAAALSRRGRNGVKHDADRVSAVQRLRAKGMTHRAIGDELGIPRETVRYLLRRHGPAT